MKTTAVLITALAAAVAVPTAAQASWYESPWFWGPTGLVLGGVAGYAIGHDQGRRTSPVHHPRHHYGPSPYYTGGPVYYTGGTYHRETRVWPFYRRTESYPIARTTPLVYQPQAVSLARPASPYQQHGIYPASAGYRTYDYDWDYRTAEPQEPSQINVTIGDNNQDLVIYAGGQDARREGNSGRELVTVPMENTNTVSAQRGLNGRMVDVRLNASDVARAVEQERQRQDNAEQRRAPAPEPEAAEPEDLDTGETPEE